MTLKLAIGADGAVTYVPDDGSLAIGLDGAVMWTWGVLPPPVVPDPVPTAPGFFRTSSRLRTSSAAYDVFFTDRSGTNAVPAVWESLSWGRDKGRPSEATLSIPEDRFKGISTWETGLLVVRNDEEVWSGPVTGMSKQRGETLVTVAAMDKSAWLARRGFSLSGFTMAADLSLLAEALITFGVAADNSMKITWETATCGIAGEVDIALYATRKVLDVLSDLHNDGLEWWVRPSGFVIGPRRGDALTLREDAFMETVGWDIDGLLQSNRMLAINPSTGGDEGFALAAVKSVASGPLLEDSVESEKATSVEALEALAARSLRPTAPITVGLPPLTDSFPGTIHDLTPGRTFILAVGSPADGEVVVTRMGVDVDAKGERITVEVTT